MGDLKNGKKQVGRHLTRKLLTKGQRLGWVHVSEDNPISNSSAIASVGVKLQPYTTGPFSTNKLIP